MATFSTWTHPTTSQVRIYISGVNGQRHGVKIWAEACQADQFGLDYTIKCIVPEGVYSRRDDLINDAEREVFVAAQARVKSFTEVLALAA